MKKLKFYDWKHKIDASKLELNTNRIISFKIWNKKNLKTGICMWKLYSSKSLHL
jgi:hypothetical protein